MTHALDGKIAVTTGAGSGMGRCTTPSALVLTDVSGKEQQATRSLGDRTLALTGDVSRSAEIEPVIRYTIDHVRRASASCASQAPSCHSREDRSVPNPVVMMPE
jgi:NADP-dependent 3-hydroxy acid dehydrogenase YdfG